MTDRVLLGEKNVLTADGVIYSNLTFAIAPNIGGGVVAYVNAPQGVSFSGIPSSGAIGVQPASGEPYDTLFYSSVDDISVFNSWRFNLTEPPAQNYLFNKSVRINGPVNGLWISKPTVNVLSVTNLAIPEDDWYGFQEEFDWTSAEDEVWANSSPGINRSFIPDNYSDGLDALSPFGFCTWAYAPPATDPQRYTIRRTVNNTLLYTGGYGDQLIHSPAFVAANTEQVAAGSHGYSRLWDPFFGDVHPDAINTTDYPFVEMRIRRLPTPNRPIVSTNDLILYFSAVPVDDTPTPDGAGGFNYLISEQYTTKNSTTHVPGHPDFFTIGAAAHQTSAFTPNRVDGSPFNYIRANGYKQIFTDETVGEWKTIEWNLSEYQWWGNMPGNYRLHKLRFDLTHSTTPETGATWNPETAPMWEIDYVRVKRETIPANLGRWNSKQAAMIFDSDIHHTGLVHQTGTVTIGTAKALINGNTSNRVVGHNIDNDANGYVSFPELDYIPLVLFQRIDENVGVTGSSFPGGEDEFSICTQYWEDHRYPTIDMNTSENILHKGFDIQTVPKVKSSAYFKGPLDAPPMHENFYSFTSGTGDNQLLDATGLTYYSSADFPLPWTGPIPSDSNRAGRNFSDMVQSFSEVRTFAYARAKKDGFWLTCRNAIAQEGLEPVLNLAPVLPEKGIQDSGNSAYTAMQFQNDNGAWGMFHPALALYDGQKFTERIQLNWDSKVTANSFLLDKIGQDYSGTIYPQYRWSPSFSVSGLPFNGALARPNGPAPTDKNKYPLAYKTITNATGKNAGWTDNGMLRKNTGGFYPYRYQSNEWYHDNDGTQHSTGVQYNIKRLSSTGIFHPHGVVPETSLAFDNKNTDFSDRNPATTANVGVYNQTAYIGGAKNKRFSANSKIHTIDFKTNEKWPDEPQKSYFGFAGAESTHTAAEPFFALSPPNVVPESILYTLKYTNPTGDGTTSSDYGGELMIANIDGTNPRIFHDNMPEAHSGGGHLRPVATPSDAPNPGAGSGSSHTGVQWSPDGKHIVFSTLVDAAGSLPRFHMQFAKRVSLNGPEGDEIRTASLAGSAGGAGMSLTGPQSFTSIEPAFRADSAGGFIQYITPEAFTTLSEVSGGDPDYTGMEIVLPSGTANYKEHSGGWPGNFLGEPGGAGTGINGFGPDPRVNITARYWRSSPALGPYMTFQDSVNTSGVSTPKRIYIWDVENALGDFFNTNTNRREVTSYAGPDDETEAQVSHDGKLIAFVRGGDIWLADFNIDNAGAHAGDPLATNERNITQSDGTNYAPVFSNDDKKVFFKTFTSDSKWKLRYSDAFPEDVEYDSDFSKPPTYKYWVLRVPVSFPEYT